MTHARRELIFGVLGLAILGVVGYVLVSQTWQDGRPFGAAEGEEASPTAGAVTATPTVAPTRTPEATPTATPNPQTYTVQAGDTLLSIATRFGIEAQDLATKNELLDPNTIFVGQKLVLPQPDERVNPVDDPAEGESGVYVVQADDTLYAISQQLEVSVEDLANLNEITEPTQLFVGRRLQVPEKRSTPPPPRPST